MSNKKHRNINVIISGYFSPLHQGHLEYIKAASLLGNVYAIVNSDEQTKFKGSIYFLDEKTRCDIIRPHVHFAIISSLDKDKSVANTIQYLYFLAPKDKWILYNSGDVGTAKVNKTRLHQKEKEICKKLGIKIEYGKQDKIESSSNIIERAAKEWLKRKLNIIYNEYFKSI